ncbi:MAG: hypothetical protein BGO12_14440 [Verrucomicrobia bacterium 61-8]|nr:MAG: hypothetical protein BGO12_14440 [Verrucomicrobia bacterium 61-8]
MPRENFDYDKIYAFGQFIAAVYPDVVFVQWMDSPEGGAFSDGGNLQVYANPAYAELEIASPLRLLQPGQTMKTVFSEFSLPQP